MEDLSNLRDVSIHKILGLENTGRRVSMRCPFHDDRTPSFALYPDNSYHCFACPARGQNAIDFVLEFGGTFPDTLKELEKYV